MVAIYHLAASWELLLDVSDIMALHDVASTLTFTDEAETSANSENRSTSWSVDSLKEEEIRLSTSHWHRVKNIIPGLYKCGQVHRILELLLCRTCSFSGGLLASNHHV